MRGEAGRGSPADLVLAARRAGVSDERLLAAMGAIPRAAFVPPALAHDAYRDEPLPISRGQVTTQPSLSAIMIAGLALTGDEQVLEIGTGYGYQTALLSALAAHVVSVEILPELAEAARRHLAARSVANVTVVTGDGSAGWPAGAPYDAVIVSAAYPRVPAPLARQVRPGGRLVQPIGPGGEEDVVLFERHGDRLARVRSLVAARFVPLTGRHGYPGGWAGRE